MFVFKNWLKEAYINGYKNGEFSAEYIADRCADQIGKGRFTESDAEEIYNEIEKINAEKAVEVTVVYTAETADETAETESEEE